MTPLEASLPGTLQDPRVRPQVICNDALEAVFQPLAGGRLLRLRHMDHGDLLVPLDDEFIDLDRWPKAGAFPLFPFHNRLRNAAFRHEGRTIKLNPNTTNGKDVMHGPAHRRPWHVSDQAAEYIEMALEYRADTDWPFDFMATQRFELHGSSVKVRLALTNTGRTVMPGGIGWHPYFRPSLDGQIGLAAVRQLEPFAQGGPLETNLEGSPTAKVALPDGETRHFSGWTQATASIGEGINITLMGDRELTCLAALHKSDYLCLEPVSHVAGAFEAMRANAGTNTGPRLLTPGESLTGTAILSVA